MTKAKQEQAQVREQQIKKDSIVREIQIRQESKAREEENATGNTSPSGTGELEMTDIRRVLELISRTREPCLDDASKLLQCAFLHLAISCRALVQFAVTLEALSR